MIGKQPAKKGKTILEVSQAVNQYSDLLFRTCFLLLKSEEDAQDILQETFIRLMEKSPTFKSPEHEKAWLLRVAHNLCQDHLRFHKRNRHVSLEKIGQYAVHTRQSEDLQLLLELKDKYKIVMMLYYVEGYKVKEIACMMNLSEGTVKKRLQRGRESLRKLWGEEYECGE